MQEGALISTLAGAPIGRPLKVLRISCGRQAQMRLMDMGVIPGADIVLADKIASDGPFKIEVGSDRFAIGSGLASHVIVQAMGDGNISLGLFCVGRASANDFSDILNPDESGIRCSVAENERLSCYFLGHLSASGRVVLEGPWKEALSGRYAGFALCFDRRDMLQGLLAASVMIQLGVKFFIVVAGLSGECSEVDLGLLSKLLRVKAYDSNAVMDSCSFWDLALSAVASANPAAYPAMPVPHSLLEKMSPMLVSASDMVGRQALPFSILCLEDDENCRLLFGPRADDILKAKASLRKEVADIDRLLEGARFGFVNGVLKEITRKAVCRRVFITRSIDNIFLNPLLGLPVGLFFLFISSLLLVWVGSVFFDVMVFLSEYVLSVGLLPKLVAAIIVALLNVGFLGLFLLLSFMLFEAFNESNYIKRIAFLLDRPFHRIGFHGVIFPELLRSAICPLSCPMSLAPQFICSGKFFALSAIFSLGKLSLLQQVGFLGVFIVASIIISIFFYKRTGDVGLSENLPIMDLPPYNIPDIAKLFKSAYSRVRVFLKKSGPVVFLFSLVLLLFAMFLWTHIMNLEDKFIGIGLMLTMALNKAVFLPVAAVFSAGRFSLTVESVGIWVMLLAFLPNCPLAVRAKRVFLVGLAASLTAAVLLLR